MALGPIVAAAAATMVRARGRLIPWGDPALLELSVRNAARGHQLLGPYSRFLWNHPGPAYFYLLAVPYRMVGGAAMFIGPLGINAAAILAWTELVRRRSRASAGWVTAGLLSAFCLALRPETVRSAWNPYVVILAMGLLLFLCALAAAGFDAALVAAIGIGSFAVQTHISTAPVAALGLAGAGALRLMFSRFSGGSGLSAVSRLSRPSEARGSGPLRITPAPGLRALVACACVLAVLWAPPVIEELTHHPGNLTLLWRFFTSPHPHHTVSEALRLSAAALRPWSFARDFGGARASAGLALPVVAGFAASCVALGVAAWRRRQAVPLALAAITLTALVGGVAGITRIVGPVSRYLIAWMTVLPVLLGTAAVLLIGEPRSVIGALPPLDGRPHVGGRPTAGTLERPARRPRRGRRQAGVAVAGLALATSGFAAGALAWQMTTLPPPQAANSTTVGQLTGLAERGLGPPLHRRVLVEIASHDAWPDTAGVVLQLQRDGWGVAVAPASWITIYGRQFQPRGNEDAALVVWLTSDFHSTSAAGGRVLGRAGDDTIVLRQGVGMRT